MLTPAQMEQVLERIDRRLTTIEQILPPLATKQELQAAVTRFDVLIESVRDDIRLVAEAVVSLIGRLERKGVI